MEKIIKKLKEKGIVDALQRTVNEVPEAPKELQERAIKTILLLEIMSDDTLINAFSKRAKDKALDEIVKKLNIRREPKEELSDSEFEAFIEKLIG